MIILRIHQLDPGMENQPNTRDPASLKQMRTLVYFHLQARDI
jgi:hypothetical protein